MEARVADVTVIALRGAFVPDVAFAAGLAFGRTGNGKVFELARFREDTVSGTEFTEASLSALVAEGDAILLPVAVPLQGRMAAWFVSESACPEVREELRAVGAEAHEVVHAAGVVFLVRRPESDAIRDVLERRHADRARVALATGSPSALAHAELAWMYALRVTAPVVALLVAATRVARGPEAAEAVRAVERNTWGDAFDREVEREIDRIKLRQSLT